ncbi:Histone transcription regulator 3 [Emydomyces testavorans]|uniref:Histone transcription regulator 3 homolog n=1 Tax=Emydomyces testavorans TaxID=2070801 RepID=A0AAF0DAM9_9EURO|nr:Histone transcription regulator 3 [Emydomyces testavorans]
MSAFVALNIEADEEIEDLDDTKEIQIEEALKLYQNALKLHSQGPEYYDQAHEAYKALFESEIFKYPEAVSEFKRDQLLDSDFDDVYFPEDDTEGDTAPDNINTASSALPQTIFLSYKNRAQFILDHLKRSLEQGGKQDAVYVSKQIKESLEDFAEALERDDTDLELWRKSSRVGDALKSHRIARFCLESVLECDGFGIDEHPGQMGIEQIFAIRDLRETLITLQDKLSSAQLPLGQPKKGIARLFAQQADIYPFLPTNSKEVTRHLTLPQVDNRRAGYRVAQSETNTWTGVGAAILRALTVESEVDDPFWLPATLRIQVPEDNCRVELPSRLPIIQRSTVDESANARQNKSEDIEAPDAVGEELATPTHRRPIPDTSKDGSERSNEDTADKHAEESAKSIANTIEQGIGNIEQDVKMSTSVMDDSNVKINATQSRKRSSTSVGNEEPIDGGRTKSRRIRARESIAEAQAQQDDVVLDQTKYFEDRLEHFAHADQWMFSTAGALLSKLGVEELGTIDELKRTVDQSDEGISPHDFSHERHAESVSMRDLRDAIENWSTTQNSMDDIFTSHDGLTGVKQFGLNIFLECSRQSLPVLSPKEQYDDNKGLPLFLQSINSGHFHPQQVASKWLEEQLVSNSSAASGSSSSRLQASSAYANRFWSEKMQKLVKELIVENDEFMYRAMSHGVSGLESAAMLACASEKLPPFTNPISSLAEMAQSLYELHLDIYASMRLPNSDVEEASKTLQRDRLRRWGSLARTLINYHIDIGDDSDLQTSVALRHLWSTIMHLNTADDASREHVLAYLEDLKRVLKCFNEPVIILVNNTTIPELSISAVEQESARISSMEFFMNVFGPGKDDPVDLIENIEPILDPSAVELHPCPTTEKQSANSPNSSAGIQRAQDLAFFLERGDATLKLLLWRRLQKAYESIQYPTKVISCSLRSIEIVAGELVSATYLKLPSDQRRQALLKWLNRADYLLLKVIGKVFEEFKGSFECIDISHLQSSMSAIARLSRLLHCFVLYEDSVRICQISAPEIRPAAAAKTCDHYKEKLRSMLVRLWTLQYALIKEGIEQSRELFDMPSDDCINYLRSVHNALGIRSYCRYSNKLLLKVMKQELLTLEAEDSYESDVAQALFDYYGLKFSPELDISLEHGCPVDRLDKSTALMMIDFAMLQANRMNIKDFPKSELKSTIDTIQSAIGWSGKIHPGLTHNKRIISSFLKSPINPSNLYRAVQGVSEVSVVLTHTESFKLAERGWYFLLGFAAFMKYKTQKRVGPTSSDDLDLAATFFRRELEHGIDRWETWYRLGQVYDSKLEEDVTWSAEKLNHNRADLALLERRVMHSYSMAIAIAIRTADSSPETKKTISDLYTRFGFRVYASSREPFSMAAFNLDDFARHFSSDKSQQMYKGRPFRDLKLYSAWHFAGYLFRKAMVDRPMNWVKCLWKMFTSEDPLKARYEPIEVDDILDSLDAAIESLPKKRDNRSDPILEPHLKLASVIHKLVKRGDLDAAHVIYDDAKDVEAAAATKHELSQHVFTKTMTLQVWKPENERPGRHFVYTSRYVYFFVHILDQLNDRAGLDLLIRRVRRKPNDYVNYTKLWEDICTTYIKLFRRSNNVAANHEEAIFKPIGHDEFVANAGHLDACIHAGTAEQTMIDLVREAVELKKLNAGLIKPGIFEDLVGDVYALLYEKTVPRILEGIAKEENRERMKVDHLLSAGDTADGTHTPPPPPPPASETLSEKLPEKPTHPKTRTKGVTRREVQRKADAIATKAAAARPAGKPTRPADEDAKPPAAEQTAIETTTNKDEIQEEATQQAPEEVPEARDAPVVPSSALPSIHGSGDDESELSELDESKISEPSKPAVPMFPNLLVKRLASPNPLSEASSNISNDGGDGDGDGDGDVEGDGDGDEDAVVDTDADVNDGGDGNGDGVGDDHEGDEDGNGDNNGDDDDDPGDGDADQERDDDGDGDGDGDGDRDVDGDSAVTMSLQEPKSEGGVADNESEHTNEAQPPGQSDVEMEDA